MADVRGTGEMMKQAAAGMNLFKGEDSLDIDVAAATTFKEQMDAQIAKLEAEAAALTGKENKKARVEKDKEKAGIKNQKDYIDACKIVKGLPPVHGFFAKAVATAPVEVAPAPVEAEAEADAKEVGEKKEKKEKPKKAQESAGLSRAERDELESLKNQIIERKKTLKDGGMSGGQINKDGEIVAWVARMNELKEKENPGCLQAQKDEKKAGSKKKQLNSDVQASLDAKQKALEEYTEKLRTEFKYSKKEIATDPDYQEMKAEIDKLSK